MNNRLKRLLCRVGLHHWSYWGAYPDGSKGRFCFRCTKEVRK